MIDLPQQFDTTRYWQELYRQPLPYWQAALDQIMGEHRLVRSPWTRAALGRNIVFVSPTAVIKLGPPMWAGEMAREAAVLRSATKQAEGWRITALIDWGDVKLGPRTHEFISPGVHMYQGDRAPLAAWYRGYGWGAHPDAARDQHQIMARAMLYYAEDFARLIRTVPGADQCQDWHAMASVSWRLTQA